MITPIVTIADNIPVAPGTNVKIPIFLINAGDIGAIDIQLQYDPNILQLPDSNGNIINPNINKGEITQDFQITSNVNNQEGIVRINLLSFNNLSQSTGIIVELDFSVVANLEPSTVSLIDLLEVGLNEEETTVNDGNIIVSENSPQSDLIPTFFDVINDHVIDGNATVNFTIFNQGSGAANSFTVDVYYSNDANINPAEDTLITTKIYDGLQVGKVIEESLSINLDKNVLKSQPDADDGINLGINHRSSREDYLGIIINGENLNQGAGLDRDNITYFPWDINQDGRVTPMDAIFVINNLDRGISNNNIRADLNLDNNITIDDLNEILGRFGYSINDTVFND